jgi:hypothetical protein
VTVKETDMAQTTEFEEGVSLMGALMTQSAKDLAWTRDRIEEGLREEVARLRALVLDMAGVFEEASVVDRATEQRWRYLEARIWSVADAQARADSAS